MSKALPFRVFDDCLSEPPKAWLIKGVIALSEDSTWYGPPGSLKSSLLTDIAVHVASCRDWRGRRTKNAQGVVFFALERAGLTRRRLAAYAKRDGLAKLPIAVVDKIIDLLNPECVEIIVETVKAAESQFGFPVGLLVFDTWSKAIAAGMADEDKAQHQNIAAANLKIIHERLAHPAHIATIGHTGKDESRGERGSNARVGHVDLAVQISGDITRTATIVKGNDQADGVLTCFKMEEIVLGTDEDGDPLAVGILSTETPAATKPKRTPRQDMALNALDRALLSHGKAAPTGADIPPWEKVVSIDQWRDELFRCGVLERDAKNPREPFRRLKSSLITAAHIGERDGLVWSKHPAATLPPLPPPSGNICLPPPPPPAPSAVKNTLLPPLPVSQVPSHRHTL